MELPQLSELQTAKDTLPHPRENIFSSTDLLKNNPENLPGPIFAAQAVRRPSGLSTRRSRRARKVLYPAHVRKYLPRQEKDPVKRWLLFCAGIILMQVLIEAPEQEKLILEQSLGEKPLCAAAASPGLAQNCSRGHSDIAGMVLSTAPGHSAAAGPQPAQSHQLHPELTRVLCFQSHPEPSCNCSELPGPSSAPGPSEGTAGLEMGTQQWPQEGHLMKTQQRELGRFFSC